MANLFLDFLKGLVVAIIFEYIKPLLPFLKREESSEKISLSAEEHSQQYADVSDIYEFRRERAKQFLQGALLYLLHILAVWLTLAFTLGLIHASDQTLYLSDARFVGSYFPKIPLTVDILTGTGSSIVLVAAVLCYFVGWLLVCPFLPMFKYFGLFDDSYRIASLFYACILSYVLLAVHVTWLFTNLSYGEVWVRVAVTLVILSVFGLITNKMKER